MTFTKPADGNQPAQEHAVTPSASAAQDLHISESRTSDTVEQAKAEVRNAIDELDLQRRHGNSTDAAQRELDEAWSHLISAVHQEAQHQHENEKADARLAPASAIAPEKLTNAAITEECRSRCDVGINEGFICTLPRGHDGRHETGGKGWNASWVARMSD